MKNRTGLVYSDIYLRHDTGSHPESARRLVAIREGLRTAGLLEKLVPIEPRPATAEDLARVHSPAYVRWVEETIKSGAEALDAGDTVVSPGSWAAALNAAGGVLSALDALRSGKIENCFCAVRPPGHHALPDQAMGFCIFNNIAVAARYAQKTMGFDRVLIVDWDLHHGNGTQEIFYDDPSIYYFSVHQYPHYPGSGSAEERGRGAGEGFTLNVPLPAGSGDEDYLRVFRDDLVPAMDGFRPQLVLISAGFDAHESDPLGGMRLTAKGFGTLTKIVRRIALKHASGRLISVLEGGYDLAALAESAAAHVYALELPIFNLDPAPRV